MNSVAIPFSGAGPLVLFLMKATVLLIAAFVAASTLKRSTAGARHLVWLSALVGVLALPLLSRVPSLRMGVLPSVFGGEPALVSTPMAAFVAPAVARIAAPPVSHAPPAAAPPSAAPTPSALPRLVEAVGPTAAPPAMSAPRFAAFDSSTWSYSLLSTIAIVWGAVAVVFLGWLVAGAIHVRRIVSSGRELTSPDWTMPLCEVADRLDLEIPPRLVLSDRIEMAFACRALSPTIVLPAAAESWADDRRRAVLFHELAHVKRHDLLGHTLGRIACALYWFHPLVWTAAKKLRAESERACDDLVLSCGARPSEYAQHLLDMVTSVRNHGAPVMALPMARKKEFEGRMLAILDPAIRRASPGRLQAAGLATMLAFLSVTIAAVSPAPAAQSPAPVAAAPENAAAAETAPAPELVSPRLAGTPSPAPKAAPSRTPAPSTPPGTPSVVDNVTPQPQLHTSVSAAINLGVKLAEKELAKIGVGVRQGGDTGRVAALMRILESDTDASVRKTAAWGLNDIRSDRARAALSRALRTDTDARVREMAAWALGEQAKADVAPALSEALLTDKSGLVRATAAWALGQINARTEVSALESAISDSEARVRETAIWAIGQLGLKTAPAGLVNGLTDNSRQVRMVTAWALGEIGDKSAAAATLRAFQSEMDDAVRSAELRAMAAMGQMTQEVIDVALKSTNPDLRRRAVAMLAGSDSGVWPWPWPWPWPRPQP
jgi:beta-lactamase regulating signal transducer with metallopeptidase domain/HEAT repeat protein